MTTLHLRKSIGSSPLRLDLPRLQRISIIHGFLLLIPLALACFAFSPRARAVCQEGCLTNQNTVLGEDALINNTDGYANTATGFNTLYSNIHGYGNTANGVNALTSNIDGSDNTANGFAALQSNTNGRDNTANGAGALGANTTGIFNTAIGFEALAFNTHGNSNTAIGVSALLANAIGNNNTSTGTAALQFNSTGNNNTANGAAALLQNRTGNNNTANGVDALLDNRAGNGNTATGFDALSSNTGGDNNTATGHDALLNTTGSYNIALGAEAGGNLTTGSNNVDIANRGVAGESNTIRIGARQNQTNTFIAGINGTTVPEGIAVIVDRMGHLGTIVSSKRLKEGIKPMEKASEALFALKPVTFLYKHQLDPKGIPQFGLVAEDVEKVNPDLVVRDDQGKPYMVRYEAVNAMLLNEFLKEHRQVEEQDCKLQDQGATIVELKKQVAALTAGLQKVSAQLELSKTASRTVLNNQ